MWQGDVARGCGKGMQQGDVARGCDKGVWQGVWQGDVAMGCGVARMRQALTPVLLSVPQKLVPAM